MRNIISYFIIIILLSAVSMAANVGVVVLLANGDIYTDCVNIADEDSAYDAFQETGLDMSWQNFGFGYFLESVEGVASDNDAGKYWSFWYINSAETYFEPAIVGASDYEISTDDKVIGLSYTAYDDSFNPITEPPFSSYDSLCDNPLEVTNVYVYVDSEKDSLREGETFDVKPGSEIRLVVKVKNLDDVQDLEDVELEIVIEDIDDGDTIEIDSNRVDINDGDKKELELDFNIPLEVDEGNYDLTLTVVGKTDILYRQIQYYEIDVNKESHEVIAIVPEKEQARCGGNLPFTVKIINIGSNDEDVFIRLLNTELGVDMSRTLAIDEIDSEIKKLTIRIPSTAAGEYDLKTIIRYAGKADEYSTSITVNCEEKQSIPEPSTNEKQVFKDSSVVNKPVDDKDFSYIWFLAIVNIFLILLIMFLVKK